MRNMFLLCALALFSTASAADSMIGMTLDEVKKQDFFVFFNLTQTASETDAAKIATVTFKPTAEKFKPLVTVKVTVDAQQKISGMELALARTFIDDKLNGIFAGDIAKSMIHGTLTPGDVEKMADLMNEIEHGAVGNQVVLKSGGKEPERPVPSTPGFQVYQGKRDSFSQDLEKAKIELRKPKTDADGDVLLIIVRAK